MPKVSQNQIDQVLAKLPGWSLVDGKIFKEFIFTNFPTAVLFVNKLVDPCEELNHYPEITMTYNRVKIRLFTFALSSLTDRDIILAQRIEELA